MFSLTYKNKANVILYNISLVLAVWLFAGQGGSSVAAQTVQPCLHASDSEKLKKLAGSYILSELISDVQKNRQFYEAVKKNQVNVHDIRINEKGEAHFSVGYHEGWPWKQLEEKQRAKECISIIDHNTLVFHSTKFVSGDGDKNVENQYTRIPSVGSGRFFFNLIFQGCFKDTENKRWCFEDGENKSIKSVINGKPYTTLSVDGKVAINGKKYAVEFVLDGMELPSADAILRVEGEKLFWTFYKTKNGLRVCKTEPITIDNYKTEPCKVLTRD